MAVHGAACRCLCVCITYMFHLGKHICGELRRLAQLVPRIAKGPLSQLRGIAMAPVTSTELIAVIVVISAIGTGGFNTVAAQQGPDEPRRGQGVEDRRKAEFEPIGIRAGSFLAFPTISVAEVYNSNIYATETAEVSDFVTELDSTIRLNSDFSRHGVNFNAGAKAGLHAAEDDENYVDLNAGTDGRIDITRDANLTFKASYARGHEDRSSPDDANGSEPTIVGTGTLGGGVRYAPNRLSITADTSYVIHNYDDTQNAAGSTIDQDERDRVDTLLNTRVGYRFKAENEGFVEARFNFKNYDQALDNSGLNRDAWGYETRIGTTIELTGLLEGEVYAGYLEQLPDDASLSSFGGMTVGGGLDWHLTGLTTLTGDLERRVVETTTSASPGYIQTDLEIGIQHELLRNFNLNGRLRVALDEYANSQREDKHLTAAFRARYLFNRNLFSEFEIDHTVRSSNQVGQDFETTKTSLKVGLSF